MPSSAGAAFAEEAVCLPTTGCLTLGLGGSLSRDFPSPSSVRRTLNISIFHRFLFSVSQVPFPPSSAKGKREGAVTRETAMPPSSKSLRNTGLGSILDDTSKDTAYSCTFIASYPYFGSLILMASVPEVSKDAADTALSCAS